MSKPFLDFVYSFNNMFHFKPIDFSDYISHIRLYRVKVAYAPDGRRLTLGCRSVNMAHYWTGTETSYLHLKNCYLSEQMRVYMVMHVYISGKSGVNAKLKAKASPVCDRA